MTNTDAKTLPTFTNISASEKQRLLTPIKSANVDLIGLVLKVGSTVSSIVIGLGLILLLLNPTSAQREQAFPHTFIQIWTGLLALQPQAIIALGILLLIATPFMRVLVSAGVFAWVHDRRYVAIALVVLTILVTGFLLGKGGA